MSAGERHLSAWLFFVALGMVGREAINHWIGVRRGKIVGETIQKAKDQGDALADESRQPRHRNRLAKSR